MNAEQMMFNRKALLSRSAQELLSNSVVPQSALTIIRLMECSISITSNFTYLVKPSTFGRDWEIFSVNANATDVSGGTDLVNLWKRQAGRESRTQAEQRALVLCQEDELQPFSGWLPINKAVHLSPRRTHYTVYDSFKGDYWAYSLPAARQQSNNDRIWGHDSLNHLMKRIDEWENETFKGRQQNA